MKNLKLILPIMAMIFAIGLSFATVNPNPEPEAEIPQEYDYVYLGGDSWLQIDEQNCPTGEFDCTVRLGEGGPIQQVYDEEDLQTAKDSNTQMPTVIDPE